MNILNSAFDGNDGSELENKLENVVKEMEKEKKQLKVAINRNFFDNSTLIGLLFNCNQLKIDYINNPIKMFQKIRLIYNRVI